MIKMTIQRKLILSYIFLAVLPTIALGMYLSNNIKTITVNRAFHDAVRNVEIIQSELSRSLNVSINISKQLYLSQNYFRLVGTRYETNWDVVNSYFLFKDFEDLRKIYINNIDNIRVFVHNDTILGSWYLNKLDETTVQTEWYNLAMKNPSKIIWSPTTNPNAFSRNKNCYSLVRMIESKGNQSIAVIDLNQEYINNLLKSEYFDTTIFDEKGNIICTNDYAKAEETVKNYAFDYYTDSNDISNTDSAYKVVVDDMLTEGVNGRFRVVASFLLEDILRESNFLFTRYIAVTLACLLVISALVWFFSRSLRKRVSALSKEMELVSKGDFNLVSRITGDDEVGILSKSLNVMAANLKKLVQENYETNYQRQSLLLKHNDIKLKMLTNQMNPHFLFNTLESLRMEARIRNEIEIADIIQRLGGLLRKSIQTGSEEAPLSDEIQLIEDYLCIQTFRYGDRIQYAFSICEESKGLKILPFLIQPIVENAIIHGLENSEKMGMININTFCDENDLFIEVTDNGVGITPERLRQIQESLDDESSDDLHIGIRNVHLRIRLRYGSSYGLTIENKTALQTYTRVCMRIPKVVTQHV